MNYLSHFFIDQKLGNHYFNTALLLPDLARLIVHDFSKLFNDFSTDEKELYCGCLAHYAADRKFHDSNFFKLHFELINQKINASNFGNEVNRKFFLAHILFEMLLDRIIVKHQIEVSENFYSSLNKIDCNTLKAFVMRYSNAEADGFINSFNQFRKVQYLFRYVNDTEFVYSISRVMRNVTKVELDWSNKFILLRLINEIENELFSNVQEVLLNLKSLFK